MFRTFTPSSLSLRGLSVGRSRIRTLSLHCLLGYCKNTVLVYPIFFKKSRIVLAIFVFRCIVFLYRMSLFGCTVSALSGYRHARDRTPQTRGEILPTASEKLPRISGTEELAFYFTTLTQTPGVLSASKPASRMPMTARVSAICTLGTPVSKKSTSSRTKFGKKLVNAGTLTASPSS